MKILLLIFFMLFPMIGSGHDILPYKKKTKEPLKRHLKSRTFSLDTWAKELNESGFDLLCLGEIHNEYYRNFYAEEVIPKIKANVLAIEALEERAQLVTRNYVEMRNEDVNVAGTPFNAVAEAFFTLNPEGHIKGVEQTRKEAGQVNLAELDHINKVKVSDHIISRDGFIAQHVEHLMSEGNDRIISIYGAKHCAKFSTRNFGFQVPFFRMLQNRHGKQHRLISVHVIPYEKQSDVLRNYLKEFELLQDDVVVVNGHEIPPADYNYRIELFTLFNSYDVVIFPQRR